MAVPDNQLQDVQTYQDAALAYLQNSYCFLSKSNKKFQNFQNLIGNLGDTVDFELPYRFKTQNSLKVNFEGVEQRKVSLSVDEEFAVAFAFTAQQRIFNVKDFMDKFGKGAIKEIGADMEASVAQVCKKPYRFFGDGRTNISTYKQLAKMRAYFKNFGNANHDCESVIDDIAVPDIVDSGLQQFALNRNNENAMSWELGNWAQCEWYESNLLPTHTAGTEGQQNNQLTVDSVTTNSSGAVTAITFSGTTSSNDADCIKENDKLQFVDGVSGQPDMRYLTFIGHKVSANPVQMRATADASSDGSSKVTVTLSEPLQAGSGKNQNVNNQVAAGMKVSVADSHRAGIIMAGKPLFVAMPQLPDESPFTTASKADPDSGAAIRMYTGSKLGENERGSVFDSIMGKLLIEEYAMSVLFPL